MLAAHRDQENLVHSHQVSGKQQPKTPGARYPKTPLKYGQNDENAPTAFAGKNGLGGTRLGGQDKITMTKGKQSMVTPTGNAHLARQRISSIESNIFRNRSSIPVKSAFRKQNDQRKGTNWPSGWDEKYR
jgi:hypothetical protein